MRRLVWLALFLWAFGARADAPPTIVGVAGGSGGVALVGSLGEIFVREGGVFRRHGGGVAATLIRAWGTSPTELWAAAARQPAYAYDGRSWFALPGTTGSNGPALLSVPGSPVPAVAVGRRIFLLEGKKLVPGPATPGLATALWVLSPREMLVIVDGKLQRYAGGWKPVPGAEENLAALGPKIALGVDGGVYAIDTKLHRYAVDSNLPGFRPRLVALGKRTLLVGAMGDGYMLAAVDGGRIAPLSVLPGLARADEPVGLLAGDPIVVVSRSGLVLTGDGMSGWKTEAIATAVAETPHAAEPPAPIPTRSPDASK